MSGNSLQGLGRPYFRNRFTYSLKCCLTKKDFSTVDLRRFHSITNVQQVTDFNNTRRSCSSRSFCSSNLAACPRCLHAAFWT